jgi:hypothetical protein
MSCAEPKGLQHTFSTLPRAPGYLSDFQRVFYKNIAFCLPLVWSRIAPAEWSLPPVKKIVVAPAFAGCVQARQGTLEENS